MNSVDMSTRKSASATRLKKAAAHHLGLVAAGAPCPSTSTRSRSALSVQYHPVLGQDNAQHEHAYCAQGGSYTCSGRQCAGTSQQNLFDRTCRHVHGM